MHGQVSIPCLFKYRCYCVKSPIYQSILSYEEAQMLSNVSKTLKNYEKANNEYNFSDESKKFGIRKELEFLLNSKIMKQATNKTSSLL